MPFPIQTPRWTMPCLWMLTLLACPGDEKPDDSAGDDPGDESGPESPPPDSAESGDDSAPPPPTAPCADGTWGPGVDPDLTWHVAPSGSDAGDGSAAAPFRTLGAGLAAAAASDRKAILLWPGTYAESAEVGPDPGDTGVTYAGVSVTGCSAAESTLEGDLHVVEVPGVTLTTFTITGGERALRVSAGASADLAGVEVVAAEGLGVVIDGHETVVTGSGLLVRDTVAATTSDGGAVGIGLLVDEAVVDLTNLEVSGSTAVGILVSGSDAGLTLTDANIRETALAPDGRLGRGVQAQSGATLVMDGGAITDSGDAGLFAILALDVILTGLTVDGVAPATLGDGTTTGDGIIITSVDGLGTYDPSSFTATLTDNVVTGWQAGAGRAGIYTESVTATVSGNVADPGDGSASLVTDDLANVSGADAASFVLGSLPLDRAAFDTSAVVEE